MHSGCLASSASCPGPPEPCLGPDLWRSSECGDIAQRERKGRHDGALLDAGRRAPCSGDPSHAVAIRHRSPQR